jgi:hypothetical protein
MAEGKTSSRVAMALMCGLAICCAVMYVTADGADNVAETVLATSGPAKSVYGIGGPTSVDSEDVQKAGTVITNTPDGRMRLTDYLTNVEKEIAAEEAARKRDVEAVRAQMARNFAFNQQARKKLQTALLAKMAANAKKAKQNLDHAMRFVQRKFAAAAALQSKRHAIEDANAAAERKQIAANKKFAHEQMSAAVLTQQRAMAALKSVTNAHIAQTDKNVAANAAQIAANAKEAKEALDAQVNKFNTKVADARALAKAGRSKLAAQLVAQDKRARQIATNKLLKVVAENQARFQEVRQKMADERRRVNEALEAASTRMDASLKAQVALENEHFQKSVKDIAAAKAEAKAAVHKASTEFKVGLHQLTNCVNRQVQMTQNRINQVSNTVKKNKMEQAEINRRVNAETKRMVKLGQARYDEHLKKDKELENLINSNKNAVDKRMAQMKAHYLMELGAVSATMKKNRAHAAKMLAEKSAALYSAIAAAEVAQTKTNGALRTQTYEATVAIRTSLRAAKTDFSSRLSKLSHTVVKNQKKFEGKILKLTGIVEKNRKYDALQRRQISELQASNKKQLESALSEAVQIGEKRMNGVESALKSQNEASKAALNAKITTQISKLTKEANDQIENLRFNSKEARAEMRRELTTAVRAMAKKAKSMLDEEVTKKTARFAEINAAEDAAAAASAKARAGLGESIAAEKAKAKQDLANVVATLGRSMLALKTETQKKIKKTNDQVDAYAQAIKKEADDVAKLMKDQVNGLMGKIADQKKQASADITAADAASAKGFANAMDEVNSALDQAEKESNDKFGEMYRQQAKDRAHLDQKLATATNEMNDSIAKEAALADDRFSKTVDNIGAARKQASEQVAGARKQFATELSALTSNIKQMETRLTGNVEQVSSDLIAEKAMQARVNRKNSAELKRIESKMNHQQSVSQKARGALRMVLDENKRAAAEETAELDKLFKSKIAKERRSAAEIARGAAKDLSSATQKMYADMAEVAENNAAANEASAAAISKYSTESQAAISASRKDFNARLNTLTNTVAANHRKVEKGLEVLTGVIRKNAKEGEEDRKLIRDQNKAMGDDMQKKIVRAIQIGETRAKQVENEAKKNLSSTKQAMLVQITNTVEKYADMAFKTISGNHAKIADNYLSLKAYAVTASDNLSEYTRKGQGKNLSSLGDLLNSIAALSAVKPQKAEGISPNGELPLLFSTTKVKVANKVTKINGMVNEFIDTANTVRMRWPMGLGKYLLNKLEASMNGKGVLQVDKIDEKQGNWVFLNGHSVGLSNKLNDFEELAVQMGAYEATLAKITAELSGKTTKTLEHRAVMAKPPEWDGH